MISNLLPFIDALVGPLAAPLLKPLAYLDPGSGSFILQIILASLLASLLFFKNFWLKIVNLFRKPKPDDEDTFSDGDERSEQ